MASSYYIVSVPDRRTFKRLAAREASRQAGNVNHRFSVDGSLAIVKVERGSEIGALVRSRGPLNDTQMQRYFEADPSLWEHEDD